VRAAKKWGKHKNQGLFPAQNLDHIPRLSLLFLPCWVQERLGMRLQNLWAANIEKSATSEGHHAMLMSRWNNYFHKIAPIEVFLCGQRGIQEFFIGGSKLQKGLLNSFVANYFSKRWPHISQSVSACCCWHGKYSFASRGKRILGGYP